MKTKIILIFILIGSGTGLFSQNPGGVAGLSSWFMASQDVYINAGTTPATANGDIVAQWNNLVANSNLSSVSKPSSDAQFLTKTHPYYNFNDVIEFSSDRFSKTVPYNAVFHPTNGLAVFTCASKAPLAFTFTSQATSSPCGSNRCCTGFRNPRSTMSNAGENYAGTTSPTRANIMGMWGIPGSTHNNNVNGVWATGTSSNVLTNNGSYFYAIGSFPGYSFTGVITETFTYSRNLTIPEVNQIQSYMAIKYGVTLGVNGTSVDYLSSNGSTVWDAAANSGYAFDVAGLARDDSSGLMQIKSHSVNNTSLIFDDIVTLVNGSTFSTPGTLNNDLSFFTWGHNGLGLNCDTSDIGLTQGGLLIGERLERTWKAQESGTVGIITLEFDMNNVTMGSLPNSDYRLLVDNDGIFGTGATAISPSSIDTLNGKIYFSHDFNATTGYYYSIGIPEVAITVSGSITICDGDAAFLTFNYTGTTGPIDIAYSDGTNTIVVSNVLDGDAISVSPTATTTYSIVHGVSCVTYAPSTVTVTVTPLPVVNIGADLIICADSAVILDATLPLGSYFWQDNSNNATYQPTTSGTYWVNVTVNGCIDSDSIDVIVNALPHFTIEGENTICEEPQTLETNLLFQNYLWQDLSTDSILEVTAPGNYNVEVTDTNNCSAYQEFEITLQCPADITIPNVFSPNGDGSNDYFNAIGEFLESFHIQVYSRWGKLMFEGNSIELFDGWDGTTPLGAEAPSGTYFCTVSYSYYDENLEITNKTAQGSLTLFR